jgi:predicted  nucleic acid-binding Zn-ribbon protein
MPVEHQITELQRRLTRLEDRFDTLTSELGKQAILDERLAALRRELESLKTDFIGRIDELEGNVKGLNKTFIGIGATILASAIGYAITTIVFFGQ